MKAYPLESLDIESAKQLQFKLVDAITQEFEGYELLTNGDLGVHKINNEPLYTQKVEKVLARFFEVEDCVLIRGAGTGAIRESLSAIMDDARKIIVHDAPIYSTTQTSFEQLNIKPYSVDFNNIESVNNVNKMYPDVKVALVQYTRQKLEDSYDYHEVIESLKKQGLTVITDDNYAVMKVEKIGAQKDADVSTFSLFKLLGPQGIGCVIGKKDIINKIRKYHYSGGSQVQGFESLECLRSLIMAPVMLAIQAEESNKIIERINNGIKDIKQALIVNAQSKVILVEFEKPIAKQVLKNAEKLGALPHPVGSESKFEITPLFYKVSGTMLRSNPDFENYWIRINPMRSGADTVIRILEKAIEGDESVY